MGGKDCSVTRTFRINPFRANAPSLSKLDGKKYTISVYGRNNLAPTVCQVALQRIP